MDGGLTNSNDGTNARQSSYDLLVTISYFKISLKYLTRSIISSFECFGFCTCWFFDRSRYTWQRVRQRSHLALEIARVATIWTRHGPECPSINPASIEICHAVENRREISRVSRSEAGCRTRERDKQHGVDGKGWRGWWASTSPRKHQGAAALYDASGLRAVFNLSETFWHKPFSLPASSDDTRVEPCPPSPSLATHRAATPSVNRQPRKPFERVPCGERLLRLVKPSLF